MTELANRAAVALSTISRLEHGLMRPRASLLGLIAYALDPDDPAPIRDQLVAATGTSLAPEGRLTARGRARRVARGVANGDVPLPTEVRERIAAHEAADEAHAAATRLLARADDPTALAEAGRLLEEARRLRAVAGPPVVVQAGARRVVYGWSAP